MNAKVKVKVEVKVKVTVKVKVNVNMKVKQHLINANKVVVKDTLPSLSIGIFILQPKKVKITVFIFCAPTSLYWFNILLSFLVFTNFST